MAIRENHNIIEFEVPPGYLRAALDFIGVPNEVVSRAVALNGKRSSGASLRLPTKIFYPVFGLAPEGISVAVAFLAHGGASLKITWDSLKISDPENATRRISRAFCSTLVWVTKISHDDLLVTITGVRDGQVECSIWYELDAAPDADPGKQPPGTADASVPLTETLQAQ